MSSELQNVPAYWTVTFHWLSCLLYVGLLSRRKSNLHCFVVFLAFLAVGIPYMTVVASLSGAVFNLGMTGFAILTLLPFVLLCSGGVGGHLYYCARAFILGGFSVSLAWQLLVYYRQRYAVLGTVFGEAVLMLAVGGAVFVFMGLLEQGHRREVREMEVPLRSALSVLVMAVIIYILSSLSFTAVDTPFTTNQEAEAFNIRTIVYLGGVAILYAFHLQLCETHSLREVDALQNILNVQYAGYQQSQESIDRINRKYHDLKHQIAVLREEIGTEAKTECLDQLEREIREYESRTKTGNKVLDAVLVRKSSYCLDHGITLCVVADGKALDFMSVVDLSGLFGNVMDNAIEGVSVLEDPEERLIHLSVSTQKGFLRVCAENRCRGDLKLGRDLPRTTKGDRSLHGYGLKSILATVEKYDGSVTLQAEDGWFVLCILIPLPTSHSEQKTPAHAASDVPVVMAQMSAQSGCAVRKAE